METDNQDEFKDAQFDSSQFWDRYFAGRLPSMKRILETGYSGLFLDFPKPGGSFAIGTEVKFSITRKDLLKHNYTNDIRFSIGVYAELNAAMIAVISAPMMETETIPNVLQLKYVFDLLGQPKPADDLKYPALRQLTLKRLESKNISVNSVGRSLDLLKPGEQEYNIYKMSGAVSELHAERELVLKCYGVLFSNENAVKQLQAVIDNQEFEDVQTVQIALWALGRQNDKRCLQYLLKLLTLDEFEFYYMDVQRAMQLICSASELLPLVDEKVSDHWKEVVAKLPQASDLDAWADRDAKSIFWEKRLRCSTEWKSFKKHVSLLAQLARDEVLPVRLAAGGNPRMTE